MNIVFHRSSWRAWLAGLAGVALLLLALDIGFTHTLFRAPITDENGNLTNQGASERRADLAWSLGLAVAGAALVYWAGNTLASSRTVAAADDRGLHLAIGTTAGSVVFVPWSQVRSVRSTFEDDETGPTAYVELRIAGPTWVPAEPRGARWEGDRLLIDTTDWTTPAHEAAGLLRTMWERSRLLGEEA